MPMTRTPVAIGSSVPAWPTRLVCARRRTRATTSWDVIPAGLSTMSRPDGHGGGPGRSVVFVVVPVVVILVVPVVGRLLVRVGVAGPLRAFADAGQFLVALLRRGDQGVDPLRALGKRVGDELKRRGVPQADQAAHLGTDDAGRAAQRD